MKERGCEFCVYVEPFTEEVPGGEATTFTCLQGHRITRKEYEHGCDDYAPKSERKMSKLERAMRIAWNNL